ncbi:hypothetical protein Nepgr_000880 [Nepenthes gracilis]|uniref:SWIM-type domain-containing protein n=1 Tax=Nepenthes gracilis TaxID=150966 RepID=A0AAD3P403_NEPGR|nr:hypothetical protein Nepgr_000880 [Nepenthes gracilis]
MKGHESKMPRMEDILNLPVQDPALEEFSAAHINWVKIDGGRQGGDDIALIPFSRVDDFVKGESTNAECPASFRIESRRRRPEGSINKPRVDGYLEYTLYWCSYGPEDYRDCESGHLESSNIKPTSGKGSRPGRRHMMRGCLCHFTVKRLYTRPLIALIIYNQRNHVDKTGGPCHGILDRDAVGTRAMYAPRISDELRQKVMSMLYVGISLDNIVQHHMEVVEGHGGPQKRDDFLTRNDIRNMKRVVHNASHVLHEDDACSVKLWAQRQQKHVFFFQENTGIEPFILGIQTDWQLQQMIRYGHNSFIASHSRFGCKKFQYPLCSLLVFDLSRNAIPVAWIISSSSDSHSVHKWMVVIVQRIRNKDPKWSPNAFLVDDPSLEASIVRDVFQCPVLLCVWHVRHSWLKCLLKKCSNFDVLREMFMHLGRALYCARNVSNAFDAIEEFMEIFVDQCAFMEYFRGRWLPKIELWINASRNSPMASQESYAAIESYHLRLKSKLLNKQHTKSWPRVDWLINVLITEVHALFWFDQYTMQTGYFETARDRSFSNSSWNRALLIPDADVFFDEKNLQLARVISQTNRSLAYTIWYPGSEFSLCDCCWSRMGNLCKHVIKVANICKNGQVARPSLASHVHQQALTLMQNVSNDPLVLQHAILHPTTSQQENTPLEDLSSSGLLQPLPPDSSYHMSNNLMLFPHVT